MQIMSINIFFSGVILNFLVKKRSRLFFKASKQTIKRNNVYIDKGCDKVYFVKKNCIHIFLPPGESVQVLDINKYLEYVLKNITVGIKTSDYLYEELGKTSKLIFIRV